MVTCPRLSCFFLSLLLTMGYARSVVAQSPLTHEDGVREKDPVLTADGSVLYFTRPDHPLNQGNDATADVWLRRRSPDGGWSSPLNPGSPINSFRNDRLLGLSLDGNRIAVLRSGAGATVLDQLARSGRSWQSTDQWVLPEDAESVEDLTFDPNSQQLIYAKRSVATASLDLFQRTALAGGKWSPAQPVPGLAGPDDERHPVLAGDGRTLYFRRAGGQWMRQLDRGQEAENVELPTRYLQLAVADTVSVITTDNLGRDEQLTEVALPAAALPPTGRTGTLPAATETAVELPLSTLRPPGSLANTSATAPDNRTRNLQQVLTNRQQQLERTGQRRQELYTDTPDAEDREPYVRQRPQPRRGSAIESDTVPPGTSPSSRERYAREMADLERMKEKFRQQQEEKMRERDRSGTLGAAWYAEPDTAAAPADNLLLPPNARDTSILRSSVRSGLYPPPPVDLTERRGWERRVQGETRPTVATDPDELDAEYARRLQEVEALREQLRRAREPEVSLTSKSPEGTSPDGRSAAITFISNTAYPNSDGYTALDQLVTYVQRAARLVEIRVHTSGELSARAAQLLSEERATTVRNYLREAGIAPANFRVLGYGNHESSAGERVEVIR